LALTVGLVLALAFTTVMVPLVLAMGLVLVPELVSALMLLVGQSHENTRRGGKSHTHGVLTERVRGATSPATSLAIEPWLGFTPSTPAATEVRRNLGRDLAGLAAPRQSSLTNRVCVHFTARLALSSSSRRPSVHRFILLWTGDVSAVHATLTAWSNPGLCILPLPGGERPHQNFAILTPDTRISSDLLARQGGVVAQGKQQVTRASKYRWEQGGGEQGERGEEAAKNDDVQPMHRKQKRTRILCRFRFRVARRFFERNIPFLIKAREKGEERAATVRKRRGDPKKEEQGAGRGEKR